MKRSEPVLFSALLGFMMILSFSIVLAEAAEKEKKDEVVVVSEGKTVKANYNLTVDGKEVDNSKGRGPLEFKVGSHQIIPGFEKQIMGMKAGEKKSFKVSPEDAYGQEDPSAIQEIPKSQMPADITLKPGMMLTAKGNDGQSMPVKIVEVKNNVVVIDFNHPLAGKTLNFEVEIVEIK